MAYGVPKLSFGSDTTRVLSIRASWREQQAVAMLLLVGGFERVGLVDSNAGISSHEFSVSPDCASLGR